MRRQRKGIQLLALILGFSLIAAACGGDDDDDDDTGGGGEGGELIFDAEQQGDTADWMDAAAGVSWWYWVFGAQTMPRAFDVEGDTADNVEYVPSSLLAGEPELKLAADEPDGKQKVTYQLSGDGKWSDNTPITCDDFVYTWEQVKNGENLYDQTGFQDIESVECPDPNTVVTTYSQPYAAWKKLFGGQFGIFPSHLLKDKDRNAEMKDGYTWSGGPWKMDHWTRDQELVLVPNENYWGTVPKIDKVTFRIQGDTAAELEDYRGGVVDGIYPQPQPNVMEAMEGGLTGAEILTQEDTPNSEALWINNEVAPFNSEAVRQAFAYSLDRDAMVEQLFGAIDVTEAINSFVPAILGKVGDPDAYSDYTYDPDRVTQLMEGDGWTKGDDGIWEKNGEKAAFTIKTTAGNQRREKTQEIVINQAKEAGFDVSQDNREASSLFGQELPAGDFQVALYAQVLTELEPNLNLIFNSSNIPGPGGSGQNYTRTKVPEADEFLEQVDREADPAKRSDAASEAEALLADTATSIPLDSLPNIFIINNKVKGEKIINPIFGPFANMNEWTL